MLMSNESDESESEYDPHDDNDIITEIHDWIDDTNVNIEESANNIGSEKLIQYFSTICNDNQIIKLLTKDELGMARIIDIEINTVWIRKTDNSYMDWNKDELIYCPQSKPYLLNLIETTLSTLINTVTNQYPIMSTIYFSQNVLDLKKIKGSLTKASKLKAIFSLVTIWNDPTRNIEYNKRLNNDLNSYPMDNGMKFVIDINSPFFGLSVVRTPNDIWDFYHNAHYDPDREDDNVFDDFIEDIFPEFTDYIFLIIGYIWSSLRIYQVIFWFVSIVGGNGKTIWMQAMEHIFGYWVRDLNVNIINKDKNINVDAELNKLQKSKIAKLVEPKGVNQDHELLKKITTDTLAPRDAHQKGSLVQNLITNHQIIVFANGFPKIGGRKALGRRLITIPLTQRFREVNQSDYDEKDSNCHKIDALKLQKLTAKPNDIFTSCMKHTVNFKRQYASSSENQAFKLYPTKWRETFEQESQKTVLQEFIEESCDVGFGFETLAVTFKTCLNEFLSGLKEKNYSYTKINEEMQTLGYSRYRKSIDNSKPYYWRGLKLTPECLNKYNNNEENVHNSRVEGQSQLQLINHPNECTQHNNNHNNNHNHNINEMYTQYPYLTQHVYDASRTHYVSANQRYNPYQYPQMYSHQM